MNKSTSTSRKKSTRKTAKKTAKKAARKTTSRKKAAHATTRKRRKATASSEEMRYHDIQHSMHAERNWNKQNRSQENLHDIHPRSERRSGTRFKTRDRYEALQRRRRMRAAAREERRHSGPETFYTRNRRGTRLRGGHRKYRASTFHDYVEARTHGQNPFGEHPSSAGRLEYLGGNKRHPGLLRRRKRRLHAEQRDHYREEERLNRRKSYIKKHKSYGVWNPNEIYTQQGLDDLPEFDHMYEEEGYQHGGNTEGFGKREGRQKHHRWTDLDLYREGHASLKSGYGKDGSR